MSSIKITLSYSQHIYLWILCTYIKESDKETFRMCFLKKF